MAKVTFFSGLNVIGGVSILVGEGKEGIIFDFGTPVETQVETTLEQYLLTKKAPPLLELYQSEVLEGIQEAVLDKLWGEIPRYEKLSIYISHIHPDHMGLLKYLNSNVQVYMSQESKVIYDALVRTQQEVRSKAKIIPVAFNKKVQVGEHLTLEMYRMDHGVIGSSGALIEVAGKKVAYTGDYKFHGRNPEWTEETFNKWGQEAVDVLITETTTLKANSDLIYANIITEEMLDHKIANLMDLQEGHLYVNYLIRDIERVYALLRLCRTKNKKLAMDAVNATIWKDCSKKLGYEDFMEQIVVYNTDDQYELEYPAMDIQTISSKASEFVIYIDHHHMDQLIVFESYKKKDVCSCYFHADGWPIGTHENLVKVLQLYGIESYIYTTGGHAYWNQITQMIEGVKPKKVIPIHGITPGSLDTKGVDKILPVKGETLVL